jgi:hypothetical protein
VEGTDLDARVQAPQQFVSPTDFGHTRQEHQDIAIVFCVEYPLDCLRNRRLKPIALVPRAPVHLDVEGTAAALDDRRWVGLTDQRCNLVCVDRGRHDHHRRSQVEGSLRVEQ